MTRPDLSANEITALVFKAARGGGLPLGHAEDLAAASAHLDMNTLTRCPCSGDAVAALDIPLALDSVAVGQGPITVTAEAAVIVAYVAWAEATVARALNWTPTPTGAVFHDFSAEPPQTHVPIGRRCLPDALLDHLNDMAAKTLVPETEASRAGGAGAGLTDND